MNYKHLLFNVFAATAMFTATATLTSCGSKKSADADAADTISFYKGADLGWITEMEANGEKLYNAQGEEREATALMKELGLNAVRHRVWVDPSAHDNWCNTEDLLVKCRRAKALDMDIMIDFHYSDWWADPGQQHKPAAWRGLGPEDLKKAIATHTEEVLAALKREDIYPKWVQVGNEIRPGMIWDAKTELSGASFDIKARDVKGWGSQSDTIAFHANWQNLADFSNAGYEAVKRIFPQAICITHLDNGYDKELYNWFFDNLKQHGGKWDMIGMSLYPFWTQMEHPTYTDRQIVADCISNIKELSKKYGCDVMIVETGMNCADDEGRLAADSVLEAGKQLLSHIIVASRDSTDGHCKGVFYWEPECRPSKYRLGAFDDKGKPTVIMEAFK